MGDDLIDRIGRTVDLYTRLSQRVIGLEVSLEADAEIKRLLKVRGELHSMRVGSDEFPYVVDPKKIGVDAWLLKTEIGWTNPEMAIEKMLVNKSQGFGHTHL